MVSRETNGDKLSVMAMGSFQVFILIVTLTFVSHVKDHVFPKHELLLFGFMICFSVADNYWKPLSRI